jgi:hypothetical protein
MIDFAFIRKKKLILFFGLIYPLGFLFLLKKVVFLLIFYFRIRVLSEKKKWLFFGTL